MSAGRNKNYFALGFKGQVVNGQLVEPMSMEEYLDEKYNDPATARANLEYLRAMDWANKEAMDVQMEDLEYARRRLPTGKAVGVDGLPDYYLKNDKIFATVKAKLLNIFKNWASGELIPDYLK